MLDKGRLSFRCGIMGFEQFVDKLDRFSRTLSRHLEFIATAGILIMFSANLVDVVGAKFFLWPLPGACEIIGFAQVLAIAPAISFSLILGRHIRIEFLTTRLPKRLGAVLKIVASFLGFLTFAILLWQSYLYGNSLRQAGEIGSTSKIPFYPFAYLIAFTSIPVCLVFLGEALRLLAEVFGHGSR